MALNKRSTEDYVIDTINYGLIIFIILITLYPFYYILINSLNDGLDAAMGGIFLLPRKFSLENYTTFFTNPKWLSAGTVTVLRTVVGTAITVLFTCLVSYGLSRKNLMFKSFYFTLIIISMYFSGGLIPYYVLLRSLHLLDSFWVYIFPAALDVFFILIANSFFKEIPDELMESAYLDGANDWQTFIHIVLPVSMPLIATMMLFVGVNQWNSWLDSAYFVKSDSLRTLSYRMMEIINQSFAPNDQQAALLFGSVNTVTSLSLQMAAMIVATLPIMLVYPFLQKHFVKGIMLGAVKG